MILKALDEIFSELVKNCKSNMERTYGALEKSVSQSVLVLHVILRVGLLIIDDEITKLRPTGAWNQLGDCQNQRLH